MLAIGIAHWVMISHIQCGFLTKGLLSIFRLISFEYSIYVIIHINAMTLKMSLPLVTFQAQAAAKSLIAFLLQCADSKT